MPDLPLDAKGTKFDLPGGTIMDGDLGTVKAIKSFDDEYFKDNVDGVDRPLLVRRRAGRSTRTRRTTVPKYAKWEDDGKYSWVKAPRFEGKPMQVGPLAQVLVGFARRPRADEQVGDGARDGRRASPRRRSAPAILHSTLGRHAARTIRTACIAELAQKHWKLLVENIGKGDTAIFNPPKFPTGEQRGFGFHEAPRGTLSHWVVIKDGKIANYQAVVPSTWNAGPRDDEGPGGAVRGLAHRQPDRRRREAARGPADDPLLRPLPRLRDPHPRRRGQRDRPGEGALSVRAGRRVGRRPAARRTSAVQGDMSAVRVGVLGLGNVLMGDDAFGPWVVQTLLAGYKFPDGVSVDDLGTPGLDLTPYLTDLEALILVDTVRSDAPPGTLRLYRRDDILQAPAADAPEPARPRGEGGAADGRVRRAGPARGPARGRGAGRHRDGRAPRAPRCARRCRWRSPRCSAELERLGCPASPARRRSPRAPDIWWENEPEGVEDTRT